MGEQGVAPRQETEVAGTTAQLEAWRQQGRRSGEKWAVCWEGLEETTDHRSTKSRTMQARVMPRGERVQRPGPAVCCVKKKQKRTDMESSLH